ncbi:MAG: glycoside hydrolase family 20 zincin-like fold domain-containing protein [Thermoguttaceae bacterium]|jgi:N-acetyl-beta-hexosaminidase|nr:glycoside hydrolase family 20 zincin-like fold domain-containing protein [Thermoguttaceae bacterium]
MARLVRSILLVCVGLSATAAVWADDASALRLVPFPKEVRLEPGTFSLKSPVVFEAPADRAETFGRLLNDELRRARLPAAEVRRLEGPTHGFRLSAKPGGLVARAEFRPKATAEDYVLAIRPDEITAAAPDAPGLFYALATLRQMIRANRRGDALPCLAIRDWPSLRWRCFQDDMTRGPSSTLDTLKFEAALGAYLKFNLMT